MRQSTPHDRMLDPPELLEVPCPECGEDFDITLNVDEYTCGRCGHTWSGYNGRDD